LARRLRFQPASYNRLPPQSTPHARFARCARGAQFALGGDPSRERSRLARSVPTGTRPAPGRLTSAAPPSSSS